MILELKDCSKSFPSPDGGSIPVLQGMDFALHPGEIVAVTGRSGSGKSTLLNILGLLTEPTAGTYAIGGKNTQAMTEQERSALRGDIFGFVFQDHLLLPRLNVLSNVLLPYAHTPNRPSGMRQLAMALLERVGMANRHDSKPSQLSGGQKQRVAIARALVRQPSVILADEPTGSLDVETATTVLELLCELASANETALAIVTHSDDVASVADRTMTIVMGRPVEYRT